MLRRARITFQRLLPLLVVALARLVTPGAPALDHAPALSKHWQRPATVRLAAAALLVVLTSLLLVAAMWSAVTLPLARWVIF